MNKTDNQLFELNDKHVRILQTIHKYEGMLGFKQIQRLSFASPRTTRRYLTPLWQSGYIRRVSEKERMALDDMPYWLAPKGAKLIAQLRRIEYGALQWYKKPRQRMFAHDFAVNDFRLDVEEAVARTESANFADLWYSSRDFGSDYDRIEYTDENDKKQKRGVVPDGFFVFSYDGYKYPSFVEIDRQTEDNTRFGREKILPGVAYLSSKEYDKRFGYGASGRFLIVTTSENRVKNMMQQTVKVLEKISKSKHTQQFLYTTFDAVNANTVLTEKIWHPAGYDRPVSLLERIQ
jgi:hypothetical protein